MNSLGLRTDSMIDCLERLATIAPWNAADARPEGWPATPPPAFARHPDEEDEDIGEEEIDDEEDLDEDFDDDEEEFDEEDFEDEEEDEIDEELDEDIDDIDIDE